MAVGATATALLLGALVAVPGSAAKRRPAPLKPNTTLKGATVLAAASLTDAFPKMAPRLRYSFAGSDQLAFQIRQGAPADVFASANVKYPADLQRAGLVGTPVVFAYNVLVVLVPRANPARIRSIGDLTRPGVKLVVGDPSVPVGSYTRTVLTRLHLEAALQNVVSEEPDVRSIVAKVALGEADAGIVYWTDFLSARKRVRYIAIPPEAQPTVAYSVAATTNAKDPVTAQRFVSYLQSTTGRRWLARYGFRLPPRPAR